MNEIVFTILSYLSAAVSVGGFAVIAKVILKKIADFGSIKHHLGFVVKKLQEAHEENVKIREELQSLRMELKGHREHEKGVKKN